VPARRFDQAAGEDGKSRKSSKRKQRKHQQSKPSTRKADKREAPEGGQQVCEAGESASCIQRGDTCKAAAAAAESLCSHALPPRTVAVAVSRPDAVQWQQAIDDEITSCLMFGAWESVDLPPGMHMLPSRIVLDRKRNGRYEAHLVAGGHRQQQELILRRRSPPFTHTSVRILLSLTYVPPFATGS
jgi:hypothetical protein